MCMGQYKDIENKLEVVACFYYLLQALLNAMMSKGNMALMLPNPSYTYGVRRWKICTCILVIDVSS